MATVEVITGVRGCADYFMGASHITPGIGGDYNSLMHHLGTKTNFEDSMKEYCRETMSHWSIEDNPFDLKMINLNKFDIYLNELKVFADYLEEVAQIACKFEESMENGTYNEEDSIGTKRVAFMMHHAVNGCYRYALPGKRYNFYDLNYLAEYFASYPQYNPYSAKFVDIASRINRAWNQVAVCNYASRIARQLDFSVSVTIITDSVWIKEGYENTYNKLDFHKITGWGNWLKQNPIPSLKNPNPSIFVPGGQQQPEGDNPEGEEQPEGEDEGADV